MRDKSYLTFKEIPKGFKNREKLIVAQYEFSGIQSFIFGSINVNSTQQQIKARSEYIVFSTEKCLEYLERELGKRSGLRVLLKSGGKLMVALSHRRQLNKLEEISDKLQRIVYAETAGKLQLYYAFAPACVLCGKSILKEQDVISNIRLLINKNKYHCTNILDFDFKDYCGTEFSFSEFSLKYNNSYNSGETFFAALKLDLDNLGDFFARIHDTDVRKKTGDALAEVLETAVGSVKAVLPIFVGGDDIFVVLKNEEHIVATYKLYQAIKKGIENTEALAAYRELFGMSAGLCIIRNDLGKVPLFYYFDLAEEQLEKAKSISGKNVVSIENTVVSWQQIEVLSRIMENKGEEIISALDKNQRLIVFSNLRELKSRIIGFNRNSDEKFLSREEETLIERI